MRFLCYSAACYDANERTFGTVMGLIEAFSIVFLPAFTLYVMFIGCRNFFRAIHRRHKIRHWETEPPKNPAANLKIQFLTEASNMDITKTAYATMDALTWDVEGPARITHWRYVDQPKQGGPAGGPTSDGSNVTHLN